MSFARATHQGLLAPPAIAAVDATGLEARRASVHYRYAYTRAYRTAYTTLHRGADPVAAHARATYPKLTAKLFYIDRSTQRSSECEELLRGQGTDITRQR